MLKFGVKIYIKFDHLYVAMVSPRHLQFSRANWRHAQSFFSSVMAAKAAAEDQSWLDSLLYQGGPALYPIELKEKSFALVNSSFTDAKFDMKFFKGEGESPVVSW